MPPPNAALGIDVSLWQKHIDWNKVKAAGISFAFIKATEGDKIVDPLFATNWKNARAAGVLRGAYHFFRANLDPVAQANQVINLLKADLGEIPVVLDVESLDGQTADTVIANAETWLARVEQALKIKPILYTRAFFVKDRLKNAVGQYPTWGSRYPLWVAHYTTAPNPLLPIGWGNWRFWQYTQTGAVDGVTTGNVDRNYYNGTAAELGAWLQTVMPKAAPPAGNTIPNVTNQEMLNAFRRAFGPGYWDVVIRCNLTTMASPSSNRPQKYSGPALEVLPNLSDTEIGQLFAALKITPTSDRFKLPFIKWDFQALPGLHGPADPGGGWVAEAYQVVRDTKVKAIKVLAPDVQPSELAKLREIRGDMFFLARLFNGQLKEKRGTDGGPEGAARWFANEVADPGDGNSPMNRAYNSGIRYFEVHNEVNLTVEGLGVNWKDGAEFARFYNEVVKILRPRYPEAKFGFPGLSPGPTMPIRPIEYWTFLKQAQPALEAADFVCCHFYWGGDGSNVQAAVALLRQFCEAYPNKVILCSEFSNNHPSYSREEKMKEYGQFFNACKGLPSNLGAMFIYVLSWRDDHSHEGLLDLSEDKARWVETGLAKKLGQISF
jgi:lysozyme